MSISWWSPSDLSSASIFQHEGLISNRWTTCIPFNKKVHICSNIIIMKSENRVHSKKLRNVNLLLGNTCQHTQLTHTSSVGDWYFKLNSLHLFSACHVSDNFSFFLQLVLDSVLCTESVVGSYILACNNLYEWTCWVS